MQQCRVKWRTLDCSGTGTGAHQEHLQVARYKKHIVDSLEGRDGSVLSWVKSTEHALAAVQNEVTHA